MKKFLTLVVLFIIIFLGYQFFIPFFSDGHDVEYEVETSGKKFLVKENFNYRKKTGEHEDTTNFYFEVTVDDEMFSFKITDNYGRNKNIIKNIHYYEDDRVICIAPFDRKNEPIIKILCKMDGILYNYQTSSNSELESFVDSLTTYGYQREELIFPQIREKLGDNNLYNTMNDIHQLILWNQNGIYVADKDKVEKIEIFLRNHYDNPLGRVVGDYYFLPNYDRKFVFENIYLVHLDSLVSKSVKLKNDVSYNAYIQGIVDKDLYFYDKEHKKQYLIDTSAKKMELFTEEKNFYNNYKFTKIETEKFDDELTFNNDFIIPEEFDKIIYTKVDKVLGDTDGYYYVYEESGDFTSIYRADSINPENLKLIITEIEFKEAVYIDDYVYFIAAEKLYSYHDKTGKVKIINNFEFNFNYHNVFDVRKK